MDTLVQDIVEKRPELSKETVSTTINGLVSALQWSISYKPAGQYDGRINLIRTEVSSSYPGMTEDYGLGEVCMKVNKKVVVVALRFNVPVDNFSVMSG